MATLCFPVTFCFKTVTSKKKKKTQVLEPLPLGVKVLNMYRRIAKKIHIYKLSDAGSDGSS